MAAEIATSVMNSGKLIDDDVESKICEFINQLRQGKMCTISQCAAHSGSNQNDIKSDGDVLETYDIAITTAQLMRYMVSQVKWSHGQELMLLLMREGERMMSAQPSESTVGNVVKRVLKLLREECRSIISGDDDVVDNDDVDDGVTGVTSDHNQLLQVTPKQLKAPLIEAINELITEIDTSSENIAMQALEHIHSNEVIMTAGHSRTVEKFLKAAAKKRKFQVIVAECAPFYHGQSLGRALAESHIETTVITDSAVFAMMSRVNKVIIGTHTVMANGGLRALVGSHTIALAAKHYSTPFIVLAPMFKLTPQYVRSCDQDGFNKFISPQHIICDHKTDSRSADVMNKVHVYNPVYDYVPPELVTLLISNICGNSPSYMYRLLTELYDAQDYQV